MLLLFFIGTFVTNYDVIDRKLALDSRNTAEEFLVNVFDLLQIFSLTDLFLTINPYIYIRECS